MSEIHVVTGAFGFTGRHIAEALLAAGHRVRTLTGSAPAGPAAGRVEAFPLDFADPDALTRALDGAASLINTYWVRFHAAGFDQELAVENSRALFRAAARAGVGRVVHVSITNPDATSRYRYFRGKAAIEAALHATGLPCSILRPGVVFGPGDILVNNIAWFLRRFPLFGVFGDGRYLLQPIHAGDFARLAVAESARGGAPSRTIDAIGPDTFAFRDLVRTIGEAIGKRRPLVRIPARAGIAISRVVGRLVGDVVLTAEEIGALMDGLLATDSPPAGTTRLAEWAREHAAVLGTRYASELARRRPAGRPARAGSAIVAGPREPPATEDAP